MLWSSCATLTRYLTILITGNSFNSTKVRRILYFKSYNEAHTPEELWKVSIISLNLILRHSWRGKYRARPIFTIMQEGRWWYVRLTSHFSKEKSQEKLQRMHPNDFDWPCFFYLFISLLTSYSTTPRIISSGKGLGLNGFEVVGGTEEV